MRIRVALLLSFILSPSCVRSRPLPFSNLDGVSRIEVRNPVGADSAHVITGADRVAKVLAALHAVDSGWEQPTVTLPAGDAVAALYRDTVLIGIVWLGRDYLIARGSHRALIRAARPDELVRLTEALEFPRKVIMVPPRGTT
jgi:hypothetical protein